MNIDSQKINDLFSIKNKVALITGGSRGIGLMIAKAYVENGAKVYITARTSEQCEQSAAALSVMGFCKAIVADISTKEGRQKIFDVLNAQERTLDILINNAGIGLDTKSEEGFEAFPVEAYDKVMDVNLRAPFMLTQRLMGLLESGASKENPARIINIGSAGGIKVRGGSGPSSYGPGKAALHFMTKEWGVCFAKRNITANTIAPGAFRTDLLASEEALKYAAEVVPLKRVGNESDIAGAAIFLASKASAFMTGDVISVDGGYTLI